MCNRRLIWVIGFFSSFLFGQNKQILYDFNSIPQTLMTNPGADIDFKWHAGFPLLSGIYVSGASSGFSVYDVLANDGVNINTKLRRLIFDTSPHDIMSLNEQVEILYGGFRTKDFRQRDYISFGIYQELDAYSYWPKDLAILAYEGNADYIGKTFNLGHLSAKGEVLTVFHVGIDRKLSRQLTVGGRFKIYSGILDFTSIRNTGTFSTIVGDDNLYTHILDGDVKLQTSGYASLRDIESENTSDGARQVGKKLFKRGLLGGDLGLGIDLGFTYKPNDQITYTASMLDLGFVHHGKDVETYTLNGPYEFEGLNFIFPEVLNDDGVNDYWDQFEDEIDELYDTVYTKYTTWRPLKLNGSVKYEFGKVRSKECNCRAGAQGYKNAIGAHLFVLKRPKQPQTALTLFYDRRVFDFLNARVTYTADKFSKSNIGLGMSVHFSNFNFYLAAENLLAYRNLADANILSLQFGLNYIVKD